MINPWTGRGARLTGVAINAAAAELGGAKVAAVKAVWHVEAGGNGFWKDGTLKRRFEPHHFPKDRWRELGFSVPSGTAAWRASLKIKKAARERMFLQAIAIDEEAALRAASFGGPQIMGFNHEAAGYPTARAMVIAMADSEDAQLQAFVAFVKSKNIATHLVSQDWLRFAGPYNGTGQAAHYARLLESAFRRFSGSASALVLRAGDSGPAVEKLQTGLGLPTTGMFDDATDAAVRQFQETQGLVVDGVVGAKSWAALAIYAKELAPTVDVTPDAQPTRADALIDGAIDKVTKGGVPGVGVGVLGRDLLARAPEGAVNVGFYVVVIGGSLAVLAIVGLIGVRIYRKRIKPFLGSPQMPGGR